MEDQILDPPKYVQVSHQETVILSGFVLVLAIAAFLVLRKRRKA